MSENKINMTGLYTEAKAKWLAAQETTGGFIGFVMTSQKWWLVIIGAVFFILSASHTANTFGRLVAPIDLLGLKIPVALVAPLGIEFGILYAAFSRKKAEIKRLGIGRGMLTFEWLMFGISVVVNGAGALFVVVTEGKLSALSAEAVRDSFNRLPLDLQLALLLAVVFGVVIPLSTHITGGGLASLVYEYTDAAQERAAGWRAAERWELYQVVFQWHLDNGWTPGRAKKSASVMTDSYLAMIEVNQPQPTQPGTTTATNRNQPQPEVGPESYADYDEALRRYEARASWAGYKERDLAVALGCSRHTVRKILQAKGSQRLYAFPLPPGVPVDRPDETDRE